jgi:6-pyruvoyltetrahydropterin/6-carboxytetrahydropterin synthase
MKFQLRKAFKIDAAHRLTGLPTEHKCTRLHGHTYRIEIAIEDELKPDSGLVMDYNTLEQIAGPVISMLDHTYLNEIPGLENPTSENIAIWLWERLKPKLPGLKEILVAESDNSMAIFRGPSTPLGH